MIAITDNQSLFSILNTTYGDDGRTTFALPDLRGRVPMAPGRAPGLSTRYLDQMSGNETVPLSTAQMPAHTHETEAKSEAASAIGGTAQAKCASASTQNTPGGAVWATGGRENTYSSNDPDGSMSDKAIELNATVTTTVTNKNAGGAEPHNNVQPFLCVNYIIALEGMYPPRN